VKKIKGREHAYVHKGVDLVYLRKFGAVKKSVKQSIKNKK